MGVYDDALPALLPRMPKQSTKAKRKPSAARPGRLFQKERWGTRSAPVAPAR